MNLSIENMRTILVVLLVTLFVFILIRELICWYFKINERVQLQKDAIVNQVMIIELLCRAESESKGVYIKEYQPGDRL